MFPQSVAASGAGHRQVRGLVRLAIRCTGIGRGVRFGYRGNDHLQPGLGGTAGTLKAL